VRVAGLIAKSSLILAPDQVVTVSRPPATPAEPVPEDLPLDIVYDDDDVVVVNKAAGMVVHPAAGHAQGTVVNALLHHVRGLSGVGGRERPGIVHRIDKGTSGLLVVAKHDRAHRALAEQFQGRTVHKEYVALVWGTMRAGDTIATSIGRDPAHRRRMSSRARTGRPAVTRVVDATPLGGVTLLRVAIATGRTHQIRVHLSEAGHPIVGDEVYGGVRRRVPPGLAAVSRLTRPFLHAARLEFAHPADGRRLAFEVSVPADLGAVLESLQRAARGRSGRHKVTRS
jgi:23S rRNA pseudouridine1911/1915/1917 synthase